MDEVAQPKDGSMRRSSALTYVSPLLEVFKDITMQISLIIVRNVSVVCSRNVLDTEMWLAFVKSGYTTEYYVPTRKDAYLEKFIEEPVEYVR